MSAPAQLCLNVSTVRCVWGKGEVNVKKSAYD